MYKDTDVRLLEIIDIEITLAKNGYAKCDARYTDNGLLQRCLCPDSNVRIGQYWYEEYITEFGWSVLYERELNLEEVKIIEQPITEEVLYTPPKFRYIGIKKYSEVIGKRGVIIEFKEERGIYYTYPLKSACIPMHYQLKTKYYPNHQSLVIVYQITWN